MTNDLIYIMKKSEYALPQDLEESLSGHAVK
jgi:hypothetical protein